MPFPKLSAVLNNCPLHALTPEIKDEILKFGENELYDNQHRAGYINLKNIFAAFYGFDPSEFSWNKFAGIMNCYNAFDTQIILGPPLRVFMKEPMAQDEFVPGIAMANDTTTEEYINSMTEIQPHTGRYASLAPDEVYKYVSKDLGLSLTYHPQNGQVTNLEAPNSLSTVHIFHQGGLDGAQAGGHWERTDKGQESLNVQNYDDTQLNGVIQLLGENTGVNPYGFELLKKHIQINAKTLEEHNESLQLDYEIAEINIATTQILKYIENINSVPKVYAVNLLGNGLSEITRRFIDQYEFVEVEPYQIFENWIRALDGFKPALDEREQLVLKQLRVPVPQTLFPVEPEKTLHEELEANEELAQILRDIERFENEELNQRASEQLARQLQDEERLAQEEDERNQRESEQLAQRLALESERQNVKHDDPVPDTSEQLAKQLQDEERLAQEEEERNQRESEQLAQRLAMESEHQNVKQDDLVPDTSEQLAKQLQDEERLAQEEEERNQRESAQLAQRLAMESEHQNVKHDDPVPDTSEQLAKQLQDEERLAQEEEERNQRESAQLAQKLALESERQNVKHDDPVPDTSEQLAKQLQDEERLAQEEEERNQRESAQLAQRLAMESEHQNDKQDDHVPDTSEQLARQLQNEERLAQEEEERLQREGEQLAQRLALESEHQTVKHADHVPDTSEQLARQLQNEERLAQEEEERNQRASEQLALKLTAEPSPKYNSIRDTREPLASELLEEEQRTEVTQRESKLKKDKLKPMKLLEAQHSFQIHLDSLKEKMDDLAKRRNEKISNPAKFEALDKAWNAANTLHTEITKAGDLYFSNPKPQTYKQFEETCKALIDTAHTKLDKHRGWSEFLVNFALGVLTLGLGLVIKGAVNLLMNQSFFFVHKTKSSELLDDIENDINNSAPSA